MKRKRLILYWLLLLLPALGLGAAALMLLRHEHGRIAQIRAEARRERATVAADAIAAAVTDVQDGLLRTLKRLPEQNLVDMLLEWESTNPLVRNVFVWNPWGGLAEPLPDGPLSDEKRRFVQRYDALFADGAFLLDVPVEQQIAGVQEDSTMLENLYSSSTIDANNAPLDPGPQAKPSPSRRESPRQQLKALTAQQPQAQTMSPFSEEQTLYVGEAKSRWVPWFADNKLFLLGWAQSRPGGPVRGVEVEMVVLLSRLLPLLPAEVPPGEAFALLDGAGNIFHQTGPLSIVDADRPLDKVAADIGPLLPHWRVAVYADPRVAGSDGGTAFLTLSVLLVGVFMLAILVGGVMLWREAHRSSMDAMQKTSFVSNVSHELKTPLTSIRMYAELLEEGRAKDEEKQRRYLGIIGAESRRLTRLVNNVLDFSRLEQGRKKYQSEPVDLVELINDVLTGQQLRVEAAGLALSRELPDADAVVTSDRDAIEQALLNLVDNAAKYAVSGGELRVELQREGAVWRIDVLDRGPGIPASDRERIFEKFARLDESITAAQPGCGLGLSISRLMLRDIGGNMVCSDRLGGGTCFSIFLPTDEMRGSR